MSVFSNNLLLGAGGQSTGPAPFNPTVIGNSVWFDGSADYMDKTFSSGSAQSRIVYACWLQRNDFTRLQSIFTADKSGRADRFGFQADDTIDIHLEQNGGSTIIYSTSNVFRDTGWYHFILSIDLNVAQASAVQLYVNGVQNNVTVTFGPSAGALSTMDSFGNAATHAIGKRSAASDRFSNTYQTQCTLLVGQSIQNGDVAVTDILDAFTFGTNGSQFAPKKDSNVAALASTAGGNSFCLDFADSADLGNDISSNNNDFTPTSMAAANQTTHTPSLQFPVLNALNGDATLVSSLGYGNRLAVGVSSWDSVFATRSMGRSGKYYYEVRMHTETSANGFPAGIHEESTTSKNWANYIGNSTATYGLGYALYSATNGFYTNGSATSITGYTSNLVVGDIVMMAVDLDNNKLYWGVNGTFFNSGDPASGTGESTTIQANTEYVFGISPSSSEDYFVNFGQDSTFGGTTTAGGNTDANGVGNFKYTVPTGFQCLASSSLTAPDYQGIDYFAPTLYEGNGQNQRVGDFVPFTDTFTVSKSAMFDNGDRRYLARTYSAGDTARSGTTCTISYWIKYCSSANSQYVIATSESGQTKRFIIYIDSSGASSLILDPPGGGNNRTFTVPAIFLSEQEWTNFVWQVDPDNATAADKVKAWVNGVQITSTDTSYQSASSSDYFLFDNEEHFVGNLPPASAGYTAFCLNSYLAELNVLDGQLKAPTDFGEVDTSTNRWIPKDYDTNVGTYGNRGFYMEFLNPTGTGNGVGTDSSGNGFNFTESNVSGGSAWATTDQFTDTPSKNFAVWDGGRKDGNTLSEGNLKVTGDSGADFDSVLGTMFVSSGKYYWEIERDSDTGGSDRFRAGVALTSYPAVTSMDSRTDAWGISENGQKLGGGSPLTNYGDATTTGDFIGVALDMDRNAIYFSKNGTWMNSASASGIADGTDYSKAAFSNVIGNVTPFVQTYDTQVATLRTASGRWEGTAPTDFLELNQDNLDDTASKLTALAWIKNRDATDSHVLVDRVRGVGEVLHSNEAAAEATEPNTVQRFLQRGVQVGSDVQVNTANESYVLWQWLIGDSATTGTVNNDGSIPSTIISADAGHFSVGTYTGQTAAGTVGHGLGGAAEMVIVWDKGAANSIAVYHVGAASDAETDYLLLNQTDAATDNATFWNDTAPTSSVFSVGTGNNTNGNGRPKSFLAFRSVPAVCKAGSYIGNGNAAGPYIDLGFKPSWVMIKKTSGTGSWHLYDTARSLINEVDDQLLADSSAAETTGSEELDILSDGFKIRTADAGVNTSAGTYIYLAMADIGGNGTLPPIYGR